MPLRSLFFAFLRIGVTSFGKPAILHNVYTYAHDSRIRLDERVVAFRNVVAACRRCNNRKNSLLAENYLRSIYRDGILSGDDFAIQISLLARLPSGKLRPAP